MKPKQLIREIHTRSLWQVAAVYIGASWALLGHVDLATNRFGLPSWLFTVALIVMALGLVGVMTLRFGPKARLHEKTAAFNAVLYGVGWFVLTFLLLLASWFFGERGIIPEDTIVIVLFGCMTVLPVVLTVGITLARNPRPESNTTPGTNSIHPEDDGDTGRSGNDA